MPRLPLEAPCDAARDDRGVLADPDQERRLSLAEEVDAREVEPRYRRALAVLVDRKPKLVKGSRSAQPGVVVGAETRGEEDCAKATEIESFGPPAVEPRRLLESRLVEAALLNELVDQGANCSYRSSPQATLSPRSGANRAS